MRTLALSAVALSCAVVLVPLTSYAQAIAPVATPPAKTPAPVQTSTPAAASVVDTTSGIPAIPLEIQSSNGVTYVNGGVGDEELAELKSRAHDFNLHVMLSASKGEYISDVSLRLINDNKILVTVDDAGPYFYARLQPGTYTLETSQKGDAEPKAVKVVIAEKGIVSQHLVYKQ